MTEPKHMSGLGRINVFYSCSFHFIIKKLALPVGLLHASTEAVGRGKAAKTQPPAPGGGRGRAKRSSPQHHEVEVLDTV